MAEKIKLDWVGGAHQFVLDLGGLRALQDACNAGPQEVLMRLINQTWRVDDLIEVIRHGLIGGGMAREDATALVLRMIDLHGLLKLVAVATFVLTSALVGEADDPVGEQQGVAAPPVNGSSAPSMVPGPQPDLPPATSTA
jgi:Phage tail tube protein, GTA-gp10